jgi:predicted transcriptional regulator YdeE
MLVRHALLAAVCAALSVFTTPAPMKTQEQGPFYVAGYSVRTNNAAESGPNGKIGPLQARFLRENLAATIPHRIGAATFAVYSDYASDEKGDYTYTLGTRVTSVDGLPAGMSYRKVAAGRYAVIITEKGPVQKVVPAAWQSLWKLPPNYLGGKRAFLTDYEIYDERAADPQDAQVEFHIGLKTADDGK